MENTLKKVVDVVTDRDVSFCIEIVPKNKAHAWLQERKLLPKKRQFTIKPLTLGTLLRISKILLRIDIKQISESSLLEASYQLMAGHSKSVAQIIALAIKNTKELPDKKLVQFIMYNLQPKEMEMLLSIVLKQMELMAFTSSIISMRGMNVIPQNQMSPQDQAEKIAPGVLSAVS